MNYKDSYREKIKNFRKTLSEENYRKKSDVIFDKIISNELYLKADTILTYVSFNNEVDTTKLIDFSIRNGKRVAVPRIDKTTKEMDFYYIDSREDLLSGFFGVLEPINKHEKYNSDNNEVAIMLVPGLVFDKNGGRIGYGGGFYDKYLKKNKVMTIGICFFEQLVDKIEVEEHDEQMKIVISD